MLSMKLRYDRVTVTGGAGFIGSHTVDALLNHDLEVWVLDNLSAGSLQNLKRWKGNPRLHFRNGDVTRYKTVESLARKTDAIVHLAANVSPDISVRNPQLTNQTNVAGTLNVLRAGTKTKVERIIFASSSSLYGNARTVPTSEDEVLQPVTPYGVSKLAAEHYCRCTTRHLDSTRYRLDTSTSTVTAKVRILIVV